MTLQLTDPDLWHAGLNAALSPLHQAGDVARGDFDLNPAHRPEPRRLTPAAVLVPLIARPEGLSVLFTRRSAQLSKHAGQVSFPGGRIDAGDGGAVGAALRETHEETGIAPDFVRPLGRLGIYETGTGFAIEPVVALVQDGFTLSLNPAEVEEAFEVPFGFVIDPANLERHSRSWQGVERHFYALTFGAHYIWGATAGIIRDFQERLNAGGQG